jgi:RecA-family ATPase
LNGLVAKGDITLLSGREGLGKSFFTMGLAVAVAEGHSTFLGEDVLHHGNILYLDQENPEDDLRRRIKSLGLERASSNGSLRYLWNQGIRLDRSPDDFLDEAIEFRPELIVLDSLTRIHTQDENSAGQMAALFNDAIQPLARDTGAAVILIHHDNKSMEPRGSVDITASVDNVLHVRSLGEDNPSKFVLKQGKTRRRRGGGEMVVEIKDLPDGKIILESHATIKPPF